MAAALDTRPSTLKFVPSTPPRYLRAQVDKTGSSDSNGYSKSPSVYVEDLPGSPGSDTATTVSGDTPLKTRNQNGDRGTDSQLVASNPFDNDKTRILFKAVDELREWDAQEYVDIPQLVIVGGQSSGKSSLLRGLTDIPFPVSGGCCTRYPTRILLHRTKPGVPNSYRITIEKPDISVTGLALLTQDASDFKREGDVLTEEIFTRVINEASAWMGIKEGREHDSRNFVANILKVELFGPKLTPLSILDLPGIISAANSIKDEEKEGIRDMVVEYMKQPQNIIICVVSALYDIDHQQILRHAKRNVDPDRMVGVLTRCDQAPVDSKSEWVDFARNKNKYAKDIIGDQWFVVVNRHGKDAASFNIAAAEQQLFGSHPWGGIHKNRRGTAVLKTHIAEILSERLRSKFPEIRSEIEAILADKQSERAKLGSSRTNHISKQNYVVDHVNKLRETFDQALNKPALLKENRMRLRPVVAQLNAYFDTSVRAFGHQWAFQGVELPEATQKAQIAAGSNAPQPLSLWSDASLIQTAFNEGFAKVQDSDSLLSEIMDQFDVLQATQLPGVINPDIYPLMYSRQAEKWEKISLKYLHYIHEAISRLLRAALDQDCPRKDSTLLLSEELETIVKKMLKETYAEAKKRIKDYCQTQTNSVRTLQSTNPVFLERLQESRKRRHNDSAAKAAYISWNKTKDLISDEAALEANHSCLAQYQTFVSDFIVELFDKGHHSKKDNMALEVHDILQIYYDLSLEHFIRTITDEIAEGFILSEKGPLQGLNADFVRNLPESTIDQLAREDNATMTTRKQLDREINNLKHALKIVDDAQEQTL